MPTLWDFTQAYPTVHLPKRGKCWARPKVHMGFQKCWMRNGFSTAVQDRIVSLLDSGELEKGRTKIYVTDEPLLQAMTAMMACKNFPMFATLQRCWQEAPSPMVTC